MVVIFGPWGAPKNHLYAPLIESKNRECYVMRYRGMRIFAPL